MKRFLAIAASAVLAVSALAFTACTDKNDDNENNLPAPPKGNYEEVDMTKPENQEELIETATQKFDLNKMFGDVTASDWSFYLAADFTYNIDISAKIKDFDMGKGPEDLEMSAKSDATESLKLKVSKNSDTDAELPVDIIAAMEAKQTAKINLPDFVYAQMGESGAMIKDLYSDFDYSANAYLANEYLYANIPADLVSKLPQEAGIPSGGKFKISLADMMGGSGYYNFGTLDVVEDTVAGPFDLDLSEYIKLVLGMMVEYDVKVSVSTDNGYAIKLNAGIGTVYKVAAKISDQPELTIKSLVEGYVTDISKCEIEAYLAVDTNGLFKGLGLSVNLAASTDLKAGDISTGSPAINGSGTIQMGISFSKYDGVILLPSDLDSYVELSGSASKEN